LYQEFLIPDPAFSENLIFAPVDKWKRLRTIVTPTLSAGKINKQLKPCIDETVKTLIKNLENNTSNNIIDAKQYFGSFTMDTIVQIAFGVKIDSLVNKDNPVILNAKKMFSMDMSLKNLISVATIFLCPPLAKLLGLSFNKEQADFFMKFSKKIIDEKRAIMKKNKGHFKPNSFIELMLEAEKENLSETNQEDKLPTKRMLDRVDSAAFNVNVN